MQCSLEGDTTAKDSTRSIEVCYQVSPRLLTNDVCSLESVNEREILSILRPMIKRYALERLPGERFGDWTIRAGYISPTTEGRLWYEGAGGEGENKDVNK
jgi:sulfite reductase beta subunit-like hemoprotein